LIPIKDNIPTRRFPIVTVLLIVANVVMFFGFQHAKITSHGAEVSESNVVRYSLIPYRLTHPGKDCGQQALVEPAGQTLQSPEGPVCEGQTVDTTAGRQTVKTVSPQNQPPAILTIFTAMFMHGGLLHIAGNMLFLWIFGNNVEDSMGRPRFILFYLLGGIIATLAQTLIHPSSTAPTLGASGAIAAVLGGYALLFPRARVITVVFIIFFFTLLELPALLVLGLWFVLQVADSAILSSHVGGGVAYFAHIGGFVFGLLAIKLFASRYDPDYDRPNRLPVY
jgi:membrane associated rhomboid family serine protease